MAVSSSKKLLDAEGNPVERLPFSPLRCITRTRLARNSERCEPYAMLELKIVQARNLLAKDWNGKSDPYVFIEFNGKRLGLKTGVRKATLAPKWNHTFNLEVFHPRSVCRLSLYDEDTIQNVLGYDGDALGFVDLSIGVLPPNKKVIGWVPIQPPTNNEWDSDPGEIYLELCLRVDQAEYEFFALMLGPPSREYPPLDIPRVKRVTARIKTRTLPALIGLGKSLGEAWISAGSAPWFMIVIILWHPKYLFPLLGIILGVLLLMLVHLDRKGEGIIPQFTVTEEEKAEERKLTLMQGLLPDKAKQGLEKAQYWFDKVIFIVRKFRRFVVSSHLVGIMVVCLLVTLAIILFFVLPEYQLAIFQSIVSGIVFYFGLLPQTVFFRYIYAVRNSLLGSRLNLAEIGELDAHGGTSRLRRLYTDMSSNTGHELVLHASAVQKLTHSLASERQPGAYRSQGCHSFEPSWSHPLAGRCEYCARRLWWRMTRYQCSKCLIVVCSHCAHNKKSQLGCSVCSPDTPKASRANATF